MDQKTYMGNSSTKDAVTQTQDVAVATYSLIGLNLLLFVGSMPGDRVDLANRYGVLPDGGSILGLLSGIFLHFDPLHLATNIIFLWLFGRKVEKSIGPLFMLIFYMFSGFVASVAHVAIAFAFIPGIMRTPMVGASGAVAGVMGMYIIRFSQENVRVGKLEIPTIHLILGWFFVQAIFGAIAIVEPTGTIGPFNFRYVGYWSHIGGFVFGMALAWLLTSVQESSKWLGTGAQRRKTLLDVAQRFRLLRDANPDDPFAIGELGRVWAHLQDKQRSIDYYIQAIELYRKRGIRDEALRTLNEAMLFWQEESLDDHALFRFASSMEMLGSYEDASRIFGNLIRTAHGKPEGEMAALKAAQLALLRANNPELAADIVEQFRLDYPNSSWMYIADQISQEITTDTHPEGKS